MSKVYLLPVSELNMDKLRKLFIAAKKDARARQAASNVEGGKQDASKPTA